MIHHLSLAVNDPRHVADVIAEIWPAKVFPFPPHLGSYFVFAKNNNLGLGLELYPQGTEMKPGKNSEEFQYITNPEASAYSPTHIALSVPLTIAEIETIAQREGWKAEVCDRDGCFHVVEFWLENRFLIELLTPEMAKEYCEFMTIENWEQFLKNSL